jgi:type IV/VI secretion system ImpK/VasF family protein
VTNPIASSLREVFTPLITYTLLFTRTPEEQLRPFAEVRATIEKLLAQHREAVKRSEIAPQDYENGCFAVVAWVDEMILSHSAEPNRALHDEWRRSPLQVGLFNTANAGEEFFERLARLTPAQKEVHEIYYLVLCLGFRGRYYDEAHEPQLVELRRHCAAHLPVPAIDLFDFEKRQEHLTPQPYEAKTPSAKAASNPVSPYWLALPLAVAAALLLYLLWPSGPNPHEVEDVVRSFECAQVSVASMERGLVKLNGHIESNEQRELLRQKVGMVHGVKGVSDDLTIIPRPFCEVMETLEPARASNEKAGFQLEMRPSKGCDATYRPHEKLVVEVTARKALNYLYIDYYAADKESVSHIFPNSKRSDDTIKDAQAATIGGASDNQQWEVQTPFGLEMVTVLSSPKPLFTPARELSEEAEEYLALLRRHLQLNGSGAGIAATYCFITSTDQ